MKIFNQIIHFEPRYIFVVLAAFFMFFLHLSMVSTVFFMFFSQIWENCAIMLEYTSWLFVGSIMGIFYTIAIGIVAGGFGKKNN
ncbi:MAG: hypothetical protein EAZ97_02540 [Bacteroidetes bacterium]|nr:MAG: hypothetical protein EAZ97_02540 [Bacteroidota bacterium]